MARIDIRSLQLIVNILYYICLICVTFTLVKQTSHPLAVLRFYGFYLEFVFCFEPSKEEKSEEGSNVSHTIYFFCFDHICLVTVLTVLLFFFQVMFANIKNVELYFYVLLGLDVYGWPTNFFLLLIHTYLNSFSVIFLEGNTSNLIDVLSNLFNKSDSPNRFCSVVNQSNIPLYKLTTYK